MQYMGGKAKIARRVVEAILADTDLRGVWFEPFVGGANVLEVAAPHFDRALAYDAHPDLVLMWRHVTAGGAVPEFVSREEYAALRHAEPSWLRGFVGFGASFGGKWFGGYGDFRGTSEDLRDATCRASYRTVGRQAQVFARCDVKFARAGFGEVVPPPGSVVYCDPPYAGTTGYATGAFDHDGFYATLTDRAEASAVYVSEYQIPADVRAKLVWSGTRRMTVQAYKNASVRTENLFRVLP